MENLLKKMSTDELKKEYRIKQLEMSETSGILSEKKKTLKSIVDLIADEIKSR